jgi:hypothetical protein
LLHLTAEVAVFLNQPLLLQPAAHHPDDGVHVEGFGEVVEGAFLDGVQRPLDVAEGGDDDDGGVRAGVLGGLQHAHPVQGIRHGHVGEDQVHEATTAQRFLGLCYP